MAVEENGWAREDEWAREKEWAREIGKNVRRAREAIRLNGRVLSQEKLAQRIDMSRETVANIEAGKRLPDLKTVGRMAAVLGADWKDLLPEASIRYFTQTLFDQHEPARQRGSKRPKLTAQTRRSA